MTAATEKSVLRPRPAARGRGLLLATALFSGLAALTALLAGAALIGLGSTDAVALVGLGLVVLLGALEVSRWLAPPIAARAALIAGVLVTAEGAAVAWLGHLGQLEILIGIPLLLAGIVGTAATPQRHVHSSTSRVLAIVLLAAGSTMLLASTAGVGGEYLRSRIDSAGFDCLEGFSGDPSLYPDAPAAPSAIRTGFGWDPIGRTCSWPAGLPAAGNGVITTATVDHQGSGPTSDWILRSAGVGAVLLIGLIPLAIVRARRPRT